MELIRFELLNGRVFRGDFLQPVRDHSILNVCVSWVSLDHGRWCSCGASLQDLPRHRKQNSGDYSLQKFAREGEVDSLEGRILSGE
jgi:hypothetical protein